MYYFRLYIYKMNIDSGTSLVAVLKKKMLDTKEEVEKVKENIQDMSRNIQVFVLIGTFSLEFMFSRLRLNRKKLL